MATPYQELRDQAELLTVYGDDPFVSCFASDGVRAFVTAGAAAWVRPHGSETSLWAHGEPAESAALVEQVASLTTPHRLLLPEPIFNKLPPRLRPATDHRWHWFYTREKPTPHTWASACGWLPSSAHPEVTELLRTAFPDASSWPLSEESQRCWFGARDEDNQLLACGVASWRGRTAPGLASIAVHPAARRRGLCAGLTAWVTRDLLESGYPIVTLGSWTGEESTHRIYRRLGYHDPHVVVSGKLRD